MFCARRGRDPDYTAAYAFDAANLVVHAVRSAGLNRTRIRDSVRALSPYRGVTGTMEWDPQGQNRTAVVMRTISDAGRARKRASPRAGNAPLQRGVTSSMSFPGEWVPAPYSKASRARASGNALAMIGLSFPSFTSVET